MFRSIFLFFAITFSFPAFSVAFLISPTVYCLGTSPPPTTNAFACSASRSDPWAWYQTVNKPPGLLQSYMYAQGGTCPSGAVLTATGMDCVCSAFYWDNGSNCSWASPSQAAVKKAAGDAFLSSMLANPSANPQVASDAVYSAAKKAGLDNSSPTVPPPTQSQLDALAGVGAAAAKTSETAIAGGVAPAVADQMAAGAGAAYAGAVIEKGLPPAAGDVAVKTFNDTVVAPAVADVKAGVTRTNIQTGAAIAAGVLVGVAVAGAALAIPPIVVIGAVAGAIHAGVIATNLDLTNPVNSGTVQGVVAGAVGSASNPMQVTIASNTAVPAVASLPPAVAADPNAAPTVGQAVMDALLTVPNSSWNTPPPSPPDATAVGTVAADAAAAGVSAGMSPPAVSASAKAAATAFANGATPAQSSAAGVAAGNTIAAGGTPADAAAAGVTASGLPSSNPGSGTGTTGTGTVTTGTGTGTGTGTTSSGTGTGSGTGTTGTGTDMTVTNNLLDSIRAALGGNHSFVQAVPDGGVPAFNAGLITQKDSILGSVAGDIASVTNSFEIMLPAPTCQPLALDFLGTRVQIDWCNVIELMRAVLTWLMYLYVFISIKNMIFTAPRIR